MRLRNLFRPLYVLGRVRSWWYDRQHPDHPWLAPGAIAWLDRHLKPEMRGFEWGSGRSTLWFSRRLSNLTSVEHDKTWHSQVRKMLDKQHLSNVQLAYIPLEHAELDTYKNAYEVLPRYVTAIQDVPDASLDFVLVDGWYRPVCAQAALSKIKPGGMLAIDNTDWQHPPHVHVPSDWPLAHESRNVMTQTSIWLKPKSIASS